LLLVIVVVLIGGGFVSLLVQQKGALAIPGLWIQTTNPEASVTTVTPDKGAQFFIFAGAVLTGLVVMGGILALVVWFLNMQTEQAKRLPDQAFAITNLNPAAPRSLGSALTQYPAITAGVILLLLIVISAGAAIALGLFTPK
jgi:hypothetical protein